MEKQDFILIIVGICALLVIIIFIAQMILFIRHVRRTKISTLTTASAGSPIPQTPTDIKIQDLPLHNFRTDTGEQIDSTKYLKFWIRGWSMLLCGIRNEDILFAKPIESDKIAKLQFDQPKVLLLKREGQSLYEATNKGDDAKYKARRTWAILPFDEKKIIDKVDEIMQNEIFQRLRRDYPENFLSNEEMKKDCLNNRIAKYRNEYPNCETTLSKDNLVIISTTLRKVDGENKVFFSIHPARIIVAEAVYSFHKEEDYPQLS